MRYYFLAAVLALCACPTAVQAGAVISVDLDPGTAGIQNTATFVAGNVYTVDVVIADDGQATAPTVFDTVILELSFNDAGLVLGAGPTGYLGGTLAGANPGFTYDAFGVPFPTFAATGAALTAGPSSPIPGFASGSGAAGLVDLLAFTVLPGQSPVSILSFDFVALAAGSSTISVAGSPAGLPALSFMGVGLDSQFVGATVTVEGNVAVVPEPHGFVLAGIGALCVFAVGLYRRTPRQISC